MKYHFNVHKEEVGYSAQGIECEGCFTQADTFEELQVNMQEALDLLIEEPEDSSDLAPLPDPSIQVSNDIVEVSPSPEIAFSFLVRYYRITQGLTQKEAAQKMGFDSIYSYQRLEDGQSNPTLKMLAKIKELFPDFSIDFILA
jgi:predicted RNase H-like HicB family nuclease/DNA-binding XRE family transcriptional regulator